MKFKDDDVGAAEILIALRQFTGVTEIEVEFNGSGDSGQIDSVVLKGLCSENQARDMLAGGLPESFLHAIFGSTTSPPNTLEEFLNAWCYDLIEGNIQIDWCNNDGGGGMLIIEPYTGRITLDSHYYETVSNDCEQLDLSCEGPSFTEIDDEARFIVEEGRKVANA